MMKLSQLERVTALQHDLREADRVLAAFENYKGATVACQALSIWPDHSQREQLAKVALLPVPKEVAVSAALRERSKVVQELAALGVEVDETTPHKSVVNFGDD